MEQLWGSAMPARRRAGSSIVLVLLGVGAAGIAAGATRVLANHGTTRTTVVLVLIVGSAWFLCTKRTSLALALLMLYLGLLDGYLKLASGSSSVTLVRDALLYALVAGLLVRNQVEGKRISLPPFSAWVIAYVAFVLVQIPNPNGGTLFHSLAGVRPHLEFVPLFVLGYLFVRDTSSLRRFVLLLMVIAAANGVVGYMQFHLSPPQLAGWGPGYARLVNGVGVAARQFVSASHTTQVRPPGLGSDSGDGGLFGVLAVGGIFALASLGRWRYRVLAVLLGAGAVTAIITSQGKGVIVAAVATVLAQGILTATSERRASRLALLSIVVALTYVLVTAILPNPSSGAYRYQGLSASKILGTIAQERPGQLHAIGFAMTSYPLGAGLGTGGPAAGASGGSQLDGDLNTESEFSFLVVEAGIPGLVAVVGFTLLLLGVGFRRCRRVPDHETRALLAAVISPLAGILVLFYVSPNTVTVPDGPYLWFAGGLIAYWLVSLPAARDLPSAGTASGPLGLHDERLA